jgi:hypothetical protein
MKRWDEPCCPRCGSREIAEIVYGLIPVEVDAEYASQRIIFGGCVVKATSPRWQCLGCGHKWGRAVLDGDSDE